MLDVLDTKLSLGDQQQDLDEERDPLGEHVAKILNQSPCFRRPQHDQIEMEQHDEGPPSPLLSYKNLRWLGQHLRTSRSPQRIAVHLVQSMVDGLGFFVKDRQSAWQGLWTLFWISVFIAFTR